LETKKLNPGVLEASTVGCQRKEGKSISSSNLFQLLVSFTDKKKQRIRSSKEGFRIFFISGWGPVEIGEEVEF